MHYNSKGEKIYYTAPISSNNSLLNLTMIGETIPSPSFEALHRTGIDPANDMYTFEYVTKGCGVVIDSNKVKYIVKAGDVMILNRNTSHYSYADPKTPFGKFFFVCNGRLVDNLMKSFGLRDGTIIRHLDFAGDFINLLVTVDKDARLVQQTAAELILKLLFALNPLTDEHTKQNTYAEYPLHQRIAYYIDSNIRLPLKLGDIAQLFAITTMSLNRIFKEHYHTTPKQYILNSKCAVAKQLLSGTGLTINEISEYLSFTHQNNFCNAFSKVVGCSPTQYRRDNPYIVHKLDD